MVHSIVTTESFASLYIVESDALELDEYDVATVLVPLVMSDFRVVI